MTGALVLAACTGSSTPAPDGKNTAPAPVGAEVIGRFVALWPAATSAKLRGVVDKPDIAARDIAAHDGELGVTRTRVALSGEPDCSEDACREDAKVTLDLAGAGSWSYQTQIASRLMHGAWRVAWTPGTFHPDLTAVTTFERHRTLPARAALLDRNGVALTPEREIVRVGVVPRDVRPVTYTSLSDLLAVDTGSLRERVTAAQPDWFISVLDLRAKDYIPLRDKLQEVPGVSIDTARRALAPSAEWGRAVLGTVAPATGDTLESAGPYALPTDEVGASGLQLGYQERLAGEPGLTIDLVERGPRGRLVNSVLKRRSQAGQPLETTLDFAAQNSAESAIADAASTTALVAVKASTGEVLAAANGPGATTYNTAFVGRYAPGSTFKVVSAAALLARQIVAPEKPVSCPDTTVVGGKRFKNYENGILPGRTTFADAFAASCNTAFVGFADRLSGSALAATAEEFGLGPSWDLGLDAFSGSVPADLDLVTRAADLIGQGRVEASPLAMAMVAATAASGVSRTPTLVPGLLPGSRLSQLDPVVVTQLQGLMRLTVTDGTASALDLPGPAVYAKTGTAEFQDGSSTGTNAWLIGYRGDLAFAVLVENGESGAHDAAPIIASFLNALPDRLYN